MSNPSPAPERPPRPDGSEVTDPVPAGPPAAGPADIVSGAGPEGEPEALIDELDALLQRMLRLPVEPDGGESPGAGAEDLPPDVPIITVAEAMAETTPPSAPPPSDPAPPPPYTAPPPAYVELPPTGGGLGDLFFQSLPGPRGAAASTLPYVPPRPHPPGPGCEMAGGTAARPSGGAPGKSGGPAPARGGDSSSDGTLVSRAAEGPDASGPPSLRWAVLLVWCNRAFDRGAELLGPVGRWLTGPRGRALLGRAGLVFLAAACGLAAADWIGWTR
jgi:hypothetical protein